MTAGTRSSGDGFRGAACRFPRGLPELRAKVVFRAGARALFLPQRHPERKFLSNTKKFAEDGIVSAAQQEPPTSLGQNLRQVRRRQKLPLRAVAEATGLSIGFLSQAERDICVPSLTSLGKIARALGVPVARLLPVPRGTDAASRRGERPLFHAGLPAAQATGYERLTTVFPGARLTGVLLHEPPGHRIEPQSHEGEELWFVLEGGVTVEVEGSATVLGAGDSLHFSSERRHVSWNHTGADAVILHVCTADVFGDRPAAGPEALP